MSIPENPKTVILKNEYYPSGLTEEMIYSHYKYYKHHILSEINGAPTIAFLVPELNKIVAKRNDNGDLLKLTLDNYDEKITGRTLSLSIVMDKMADYFVIDIDCPDNYNEDKKKDCVEELLTFINSKKEVSSNRVTNSATNYHVYGYLNKKMNIDELRNKLEEELKVSFLDKYYVNKRGKKDKPNLDLTPVYYKGSHTCPYGLNRNGTMCMDITNKWKTFNREKSIIK